MPSNIENEFLTKLAKLCKKYDATFDYTIDDDGIHINLADKEIFIGYLERDAAEELRKAIN